MYGTGSVIILVVCAHCAATALYKWAAGLKVKHALGD